MAIPGLVSAESTSTAVVGKPTPGIVTAPSAPSGSSAPGIVTTGPQIDYQKLIAKGREGTLTDYEKEILSNITVEGSEKTVLQAVEEDLANFDEFKKTHVQVGPATNKEWITQEDFNKLSLANQTDLKVLGIAGFQSSISEKMSAAGAVTTVEGVPSYSLYKALDSGISSEDLEDWGFSIADITAAADTKTFMDGLESISGAVDSAGQVDLVKALQGGESSDSLKKYFDPVEVDKASEKVRVLALLSPYGIVQEDGSIDVVRALGIYPITEKDLVDVLGIDKTAYDEALKVFETTVVVGPNSDRIDKSYYESLTPDQQELLGKVGIEEFNKQAFITVGKGTPDEAVITIESYNALSAFDKNLILISGIGALTRYYGDAYWKNTGALEDFLSSYGYTAAHITLAAGEYINSTMAPYGGWALWAKENLVIVPIGSVGAAGDPYQTGDTSRLFEANEVVFVSLDQWNKMAPMERDRAWIMGFDAYNTGIVGTGKPPLVNITVAPGVDIPTQMNMVSLITGPTGYVPQSDTALDLTGVDKADIATRADFNRNFISPDGSVNILGAISSGYTPSQIASLSGLSEGYVGGQIKLSNLTADYFTIDSSGGKSFYLGSIIASGAMTPDELESAGFDSLVVDTAVEEAEAIKQGSLSGDETRKILDEKYKITDPNELVNRGYFSDWNEANAYIRENGFLYDVYKAVEDRAVTIAGLRSLGYAEDTLANIERPGTYTPFDPSKRDEYVPIDLTTDKVTAMYGGYNPIWVKASEGGWVGELKSAGRTASEFIPVYGTIKTVQQRGLTSGWSIASMVGDILIVAPIAKAAITPMKAIGRSELVGAFLSGERGSVSLQTAPGTFTQRVRSALNPVRVTQGPSDVGMSESQFGRFLEARRTSPKLDPREFKNLETDWGSLIGESRIREAMRTKSSSSWFSGYKSRFAGGPSGVTGESSWSIPDSMREARSAYQLSGSKSSTAVRDWRAVTGSGAGPWWSAEAAIPSRSLYVPAKAASLGKGLLVTVGASSKLLTALRPDIAPSTELQSSALVTPLSSIDPSTGLQSSALTSTLTGAKPSTRPSSLTRTITSPLVSTKLQTATQTQTQTKTKLAISTLTAVRLDLPTSLKTDLPTKVAPPFTIVPTIPIGSVPPKVETPPVRPIIPIPFLWPDGKGGEDRKGIVYSLTADVSPRNKGNVTPESEVYNAGEMAIVRAVPVEGTRFVKWKGDVDPGKETTNPLVVRMDRDKQVVAVMSGTPIERFREMPELFLHLPSLPTAAVVDPLNPRPLSLSGKVRIQKKWQIK